MGVIFIMAALFGYNNAEFFETAKQQQDDGYEWKYVGKQFPDGSPAITIKPELSEEFIIYKLKKYVYNLHTKSMQLLSYG